MANDPIPDPTNVPGSEGILPATDQGFRDDPPRDDPASTGIDDDGTGEVLAGDPLNMVGKQAEEPDFNDPSHLMRRIPEPGQDPDGEDVTSDPA
jgi:hypothetical protein